MFNTVSGYSFRCSMICEMFGLIQKQNCPWVYI